MTVDATSVYLYTAWEAVHPGAAPRQVRTYTEILGLVVA